MGGETNMKSILFTHFKEKLLSREKQRTFRVLFIQKYIVGDTVKIDFKEGEKRETLYLAKIKEIYPKQLGNVGEKEAKLDGFDSIEAFRKGIMEINNIKNLEHWGFFTVFSKIKNILEFGKDGE